MSITQRTALCLVLIFTVIAKHGSCKQPPVVGYAPGVSGMPPVDVKNCEIPEILKDPSLSNALECNRPCHVGQKSKICYYKFVVERYPISGQACDYCTPNVTNSLCANCQCILGDGVERMAVVVNRMLPGPSIQVCRNDVIVVDVHNKIKEDGITIHWHGVYQKGTQYSDGVPEVTQCPITLGKIFRYQFPAKNSGTHFWHAHTGLSKMDGIFGSLIIRDPIERDIHAHLFDYDLANHVILVNDWMHEAATARFPGRNSGVTGQSPDTFFINGRGKFLDGDGNAQNGTFEVITVEANKRYRFRYINSFCATCAGELTIEGHNMTTIATDGQSTKPVTVDAIVTLPAERFDFILHTNQKPGAYWIQLRGLNRCVTTRTYQLAILQYIGAPTEPRTPLPPYGGISSKVVLNPVDTPCNPANPDMICVNNLTHAYGVHPRIMRREPDLKFYLPIGFNNPRPDTFYQPNTYKNFLIPAPNAISMGTMDNIQFTFPPVPPLSQYNDLPPNPFCNANNLPRGCRGNCTCTHVLKIPLNAVVEVIIIDMSRVPGLTHPFHLHGYAFRVLSMGQPLGPYRAQSAISVDYVKELERQNNLDRKYSSPVGKDTIALPNNGYVVMRFRAHNPGYWLFHCHFVYHHNVGMELLFDVGKRSDLPPVPKNFPRCGHFKPEIVPYDKYTEKKSYVKDNWNDWDEWKELIESYWTKGSELWKDSELLKDRDWSEESDWGKESNWRDERKKREEEKSSIMDIGKLFELW